MYKFDPILKTLVWGTESWVLSGVPGSESIVSEGPDKGRKISEIWPGEFPLLIKFIDARRDLSIQVHPDDELAAKRHSCRGKTEMWYITGAEKGASLISGLKVPLTPEEYVRRVSEGSITEVLASHEVHPGDVFFLPAGRIHAIGGGCRLAEIQQTSDITYRIYDYNRPGLDGKPRQLHTEQAKDAIDYRVFPDYRTHYEACTDKEVLLIDCPQFRTTRLDLTKPFRKSLAACGDFLVLVALEGGGSIEGPEGKLDISAGEAVLVPSRESEVVIVPGKEGLNLLATCIPPRESGEALPKTEAVVVKNAGSHFLLSCLPEWNPFPAVLRGRVRLNAGNSTNPVAVGDKVSFEAALVTDREHPAVITEVHPRSNYVIRRSTNLSRQSHVIASNISRAFIVCTLYFPEIKLPFLDRLLVTCEVYKIPVTIVLNKADLVCSEVPDEVEHFCNIYRSAGYEVILTSARTGEGLEKLRERVAEGVCLFSGESGVGKSSLVKALDPSLDPKIGRISDVHLQGRHTTSLYEMYPVSSGGYIIDTPGLRGFGLVDLEKEEIFKYFPEMLSVADDCRFVPCTHTHEPGCAVKRAVDEGTISAERYNSYLGMLEEDKKFR